MLYRWRAAAAAEDANVKKRKADELYETANYLRSTSLDRQTRACRWQTFFQQIGQAADHVAMASLAKIQVIDDAIARRHLRIIAISDDPLLAKIVRLAPLTSDLKSLAERVRQERAGAWQTNPIELD